LAWLFQPTAQPTNLAVLHDFRVFRLFCFESYGGFASAISYYEGSPPRLIGDDNQFNI